MSGGITTADVTEMLRYAEAGFAPRRGLAPATSQAYASDWRHFAGWCDARDIAPLGADPEAVSAYLSDLARAGRKASTIARKAAAIASRHRIAGRIVPTSTDAVRTVKRGIRRVHGIAKTQKTPATHDVVAAMLDACGTDLVGLRDRALVSFGYAAALGPARLVALTVDALPQVEDDPRLRPVEHLRAWLAAAGIVEGRVFRSVISGHVGDALTVYAISLRIKHLAARAGHDGAAFSASSLRSGVLRDHGLPLRRSRAGR